MTPEECKEEQMAELEALESIYIDELEGWTTWFFTFDNFVFIQRCISFLTVAGPLKHVLFTKNIRVLILYD